MGSGVIRDHSSNWPAEVLAPQIVPSDAQRRSTSTYLAPDGCTGCDLKRKGAEEIAMAVSSRSCAGAEGCIGRVPQPCSNIEEVLLYIGEIWGY
jgi:hypothetical protein